MQTARTLKKRRHRPLLALTSAEELGRFRSRKVSEPATLKAHVQGERELGECVEATGLSKPGVTAGTKHYVSGKLDAGGARRPASPMRRALAAIWLAAVLLPGCSSPEVTPESSNSSRTMTLAEASSALHRDVAKDDKGLCHSYANYRAIAQESCQEHIRSALALMLAGARATGDDVLWVKYNGARVYQDSCGPEQSRKDCVADSKVVRDWVKHWGLRADELPEGNRN